MVNPWSVLIALTGMKLDTPPTALEVIFTVSVQDAPLFSDTPAMLTELPPGVAVTIPPGQVVAAAGVELSVMPFRAEPLKPSTVK